MEMAYSKDFSHNIFLHVFFVLPMKFISGFPSSLGRAETVLGTAAPAAFPSPSAEGLRGPHPASIGDGGGESHHQPSAGCMNSSELGFDLTSATRRLQAEQCWS